MNPFNFVTDIQTNKKYLFNIDTEDEYNPFIINRALSQHRDCLFWANEMNKAYISKRMQHDFLFHLVRKYRRPFVKWVGKSKDETLELLASYFSVSINKAKEISMILNESEIKMIKEQMNKGGVNGRSKGLR